MAWLVSEARVLASAEVADDPAARRRGLLKRDGFDGALVIEPCRWIHTIGMRFPIDVAYLDADGVVVKTIQMHRHRVGIPGRPRADGSSKPRPARSPAGACASATSSRSAATTRRPPPDGMSTVWLVATPIGNLGDLRAAGRRDAATRRARSAARTPAARVCSCNTPASRRERLAVCNDHTEHRPDRRRARGARPTAARWRSSATPARPASPTRASASCGPPSTPATPSARSPGRARRSWR